MYYLLTLKTLSCKPLLLLHFFTLKTYATIHNRAPPRSVLLPRNVRLTCNVAMCRRTSPTGRMANAPNTKHQAIPGVLPFLRVTLFGAGALLGGVSGRGVPSPGGERLKNKFPDCPSFAPGCFLEQMLFRSDIVASSTKGPRQNLCVPEKKGATPRGIFAPGVFFFCEKFPPYL